MQRTMRILAIGLACLSGASQPVVAIGMSLDDVVPNFFGVGAGVTTEWYGASDSMAGAVPGARVSPVNSQSGAGCTLTARSTRPRRVWASP